MEDALYLYKLQLVEYWPNTDPEDGEPDMPADAIAHREWAIYVDWVEFDGRWFSPSDSSLAKFFSGELVPDGESPAEETVKSVLDPLLKVDKEGLFSPEALKIVRTEFSPNYLSSASDVEVKKILANLRREVQCESNPCFR